MAAETSGIRTMTFLELDAARKKADERLNQELIRIRNLPKKSKIKICNKHGLKHAHHMNTGLLKSLEIDLSVLQREQRRVVNELSKKRKVFTTTTKRSFPDLLPLMGRGRGPVVPNHKSPKRFHSSWSQTDFSNLKYQENIIQKEHKKELLLTLTEQSKQQTRDIMHNNLMKLRKAISPVSGIEPEPFVTRLNRRRLDLRKSCFPSLLEQEENTTNKISLIGSQGNRTTMYARKLESIQEKHLLPGQNGRTGKTVRKSDTKPGRIKERINVRMLPSINAKHVNFTKQE